MTDDTDQHELEILVARGREALERKDIDTAARHLQAALKIDPNHKDAARFMRFVQLAKRRASEAQKPATREASASDSPRKTQPPGAFKMLRNPRRRSNPDND